MQARCVNFPCINLLTLRVTTYSQVSTTNSGDPSHRTAHLREVRSTILKICRLEASRVATSTDYAATLSLSTQKLQLSYASDNNSSVLSRTASVQYNLPRSPISPSLTVERMSWFWRSTVVSTGAISTSVTQAGVSELSLYQLCVAAWLRLIRLAERLLSSSDSSRKFRYPRRNFRGSHLW